MNWTSFPFLVIITAVGIIISVLVYLAVSSCEVIGGPGIVYEAGSLYTYETEDCHGERITGAFAAGAVAGLTLILLAIFVKVFNEE